MTTERKKKKWEYYSKATVKLPNEFFNTMAEEVRKKTGRACTKDEFNAAARFWSKLYDSADSSTDEAMARTSYVADYMTWELHVDVNNSLNFKWGPAPADLWKTLDKDNYFLVDTPANQSTGNANGKHMREEGATVDQHKAKKARTTVHQRKGEEACTTEVQQQRQSPIMNDGKQEERARQLKEEQKEFKELTATPKFVREKFTEPLMTAKEQLAEDVPLTLEDIMANLDLGEANRQEAGFKWANYYSSQLGQQSFMLQGKQSRSGYLSMLSTIEKFRKDIKYTSTNSDKSPGVIFHESLDLGMALVLSLRPFMILEMEWDLLEKANDQGILKKDLKGKTMKDADGNPIAFLTRNQIMERAKRARHHLMLEGQLNGKEIAALLGNIWVIDLYERKSGQSILGDSQMSYDIGYLVGEPRLVAYHPVAQAEAKEQSENRQKTAVAAKGTRPLLPPPGRIPGEDTSPLRNQNPISVPTQDKPTNSTVEIKKEEQDDNEAGMMKMDDEDEAGSARVDAGIIEEERNGKKLRLSESWRTAKQNHQ